MARNAELNRDVALKFLKPERARDAESLRRFLQEAEVTGRLEHPGVVPIYALGTDASGAPCYAMRFIRGETLQDAIDALPRRREAGSRPVRAIAGLARAAEPVRVDLQHGGATRTAGASFTET